jgi:hypothetical protein
MARRTPPPEPPGRTLPDGELPARPPLRVPTRHGYGLVLAMIVVTYSLALVADRGWIVTLLIFVQTATVWQSLRTSHAAQGARMFAAVVFLLALVAAVINLFTTTPVLTGLAFLAASGLYLIAPFSIVRDLGSRRGVDLQTMFGAVAAYLLIGMAFGFAYQCVAELQSGPLFGDNGDPVLTQTLFFSFVTMTTVGYGDLVPAGNPAQTIAVMEALFGQLFLVTAVAKVVEQWRPRAWRGRENEEQAP